MITTSWKSKILSFALICVFWQGNQPIYQQVNAPWLFAVANNQHCQNLHCIYLIVSYMLRNISTKAQTKDRPSILHHCAKKIMSQRRSSVKE